MLKLHNTHICAQNELLLLVQFATRAIRLVPLPTNPNLGKSKDWMSPKAFLAMLALIVGVAMKLNHT